jgi:TolB-like protein/lipoprotein NlpI
MSLIQELKRRNVFRVGIAYVVGAWLLLQVADIVFETIGSPPWVMQTLLAVLAIGLPFALFFAWAFELTPEGVKREKEVDRSQSITPQTGKKLNNAILVLMALAIAYLLYDKFSAQPGSEHFSQQTAGQTTEADEKNALTPDEAIAEAKPAVTRQSIAVLPFENRSEQQSDVYFVEGIHDDLLTNLARIGDLKVISRTSVERYANSDKSLPEIAKELGVATVMEGAVQRAGNQVRINVQLIDASTDEHLWAEIFDRELTTENLFAIQTEISQAIARALKATLTHEEQERISQQPTDSLAAYNAYLRGRQLVKSRDSEALAQAKGEFEQALDLDPEYAQAWVGLAEANIYSAVYGTQPFADALKQYGECADHAISLNPELGEAWAIRGAWLGMKEKVPEAVQAFKRALALSPNDANVLKLYAEMLRQDVGTLEQALAMIDRAIELDPYFTVSRTVRAAIYEAMGMRDRAAAEYRTVIELDPTSSVALSAYANFAMYQLGDYGLALRNFTQAMEHDPGSPQLYTDLAWLHLNLNHPDALDDLKARVDEIDPEHSAAGMIDALRQLHGGNLDGAIEALNWTVKRSYTPYIEFTLSQAYAMAGRWSEARDHMVLAMPWLQQPETWPQQIPRYLEAACHASWILQHSGDTEGGVELSRQTLAFLENEVLPRVENQHLAEYDMCLAATGQTERAMAALEARLDHGEYGDWWIARNLPVYSGLRLDPRFAEAWARVEAEANRQRDQLIAEGVL